VLAKSFAQVGDLTDAEINKITWQNACRFYDFDPFAHIPKEQCTVGALRAQATDVDTTARRYGPPPDEDKVHATVEAAKANRQRLPGA
jgi:hypothetical protein